MSDRTNKKGKDKQWTKAKWTGFVNVYLNPQEKLQIKDSLPEDSALFTFLVDAAADGYKVSLSYSIPEDVYTVSLTGQYTEKMNAGITMSQRHRDFRMAIAALLWCSQEDGMMSDWSERFTTGDDIDW